MAAHGLMRFASCRPRMIADDRLEATQNIHPNPQISHSIPEYWPVGKCSRLARMYKRSHLGGPCMKALCEMMLKASINSFSQENHDQHEPRSLSFFDNRTSQPPLSQSAFAEQGL
ncbi:hypothetical protein PSP6_510024 [Paraburkholderia tropica]|nr:hypothetical protein PSP6_510024 [Paraburkholderia tropica]